MGGCQFAVSINVVLNVCECGFGCECEFLVTDCAWMGMKNVQKNCLTSVLHVMYFPLLGKMYLTFSVCSRLMSSHGVPGASADLFR